MKNLFTNSRTRWLGMVICTCMLLLWNAHAWAAMYVPGYGGSWGTTSNAMSGSGPWTFTAYWSSAQEFKIHDGTNWIGSPSGSNPYPLAFGTEYTLTTGGGNNMKFSSVPSDGGRYKITVRKSGSTYYLTATKEVEEGSTAYSISSSPYIYFNVAAASSTYTAASILLGKSDGSQDYAMSGKISGTQLFYKQMPNWSNYKTFLFIDANNWGGSWSGEKVTQRIGGATNTNTYNTGMSGDYHMFTVDSGDDNAGLTYTSQSSYGALLNKTQTVEVYVKVGSGSYTKRTSSWPGTLTPDRYYMSSATATTHANSTALTASSSVTVSAVLTSAFSLSESSTDDGYDFDGWGTSSSATPSGKNSPYSISSIEGANTICAFFTEKAYDLTFTHNGHGTIKVAGTTVSSGSTAKANYYTTKTLVAEASSGYHFTGWTVSGTNDDKVTIADKTSTGTSTTIFATAAGATVTAGFAADAANSLTVSAGTGISDVTGSDADISAGDNIAITATVADGYTWDRWTLSGSGTLSTFTATTKNQTVTVGTAGNMTLTASATENMSSLSVSRTIDEGSPSIAAPTVTGSYTTVGYATTRTITAAAAATGYALTGWTITNGARTDGGAANANPITVQSDGTGSAVTVAANYSIQSYTISASNSNVTYSPASGTSFKYGATGKKMTITPKSGYKITNITSNNGAISASADNNAAGSWTVTGTMPGANVTLTVTTAAVSTVYLQGRFRIRTASGVESYKSLGSATAENWSSEWVTGGTSQISMTYNYITGIYDLVTYRSAAELKNDGNLYFFLRVGSTNTYPTSSNLTVPSSKPGSANAQTSTGNNFHFNDNGDFINVVLHYDDANKKLWYTGTAETVYSTTCYAGDHGSINAKGTAIAKNGNSTVNIGTNSPISATPESGYSFDYWETSGGVTVADIYSASTTATATAASGSITAHYLANSGWYLHGVIDGYTSWETSAKERPVDRPYRGISGVYYRRITNLDNNAYFGIHDGTNKYSGHESTSSDYNYTTLNTAVQLYVNSSKSFQAKDDFDNNWVVIKTTDTKKMWIQSPATYYTVTISSDHGTVTLKEKLYGGLETVKFASGETIHVEIDTVAHYSIASVSLGATAVSMSKSGTKYVGDAVMPASDATLTVTYTPWYQVKLAASPATAADAPTAAKTTGGASVANNSYVLSGTSVTFTKQSANGGYTWDHWENNGSGSETGNTYVATISATTTVTAVYTPNTYALTFDLTNGGSLSDETSKTATFDATSLASCPTANKAGYCFDGWYTAATSGKKVINPDGSFVANVTDWTDEDGKWKVADEATVYAVYVAPKIELEQAGKGLISSMPGYDTLIVNQSFGCTPAADYNISYTVGYRVSHTQLAPQPKINYCAAAVAGVRHDTIIMPVKDGANSYEVVAYLKTGTTRGSGTDVTTDTLNVDVETSYAVKVRAVVDGVEIAEERLALLYPSFAAISVTIWKEIDGYELDSIDLGVGVTVKDTTERPDCYWIRYYAANASTITAVYKPKANTVYLFNATNKACMYAASRTKLYDYGTGGYWHTSGETQKGAGSYGMTGDTVIATDFDSPVWMASIGGSTTSFAFTSDKLNGVEEFYSYTASNSSKLPAHVIYRTDYNATLPMFVPVAKDKDDCYIINKNGDDGWAQYYRGFWVKRSPDLDSTGYYLKVYDKVSGDPAPKLIQSVPLRLTQTGEDGTWELTATIDLEANKTYGFKFTKATGANSVVWYADTNEGTMTSAAHTGWDNFVTSDKKNTGLTTTAAGDYTFHIYCVDYGTKAANAASATEVQGKFAVTVDYAAESGDYRVIYSDATQTEVISSPSIRPRANGQDTVSFFIRKNSESRVMKIQKFTTSPSAAWNDVSTVDLSGIAKDSVYVIYLEQDEDMTTIEEKGIDFYDGDYYIRTDCVDEHKWDYKKSLDNHRMIPTDYGMTAKQPDPFSHYYVHWLTGNSNVKFIVANKYAPCLSDTVITDDWVTDTGGNLGEKGANIRFMYNKGTNKAMRAYLYGSQENDDDYLKLTKTSGSMTDRTSAVDEITFTDLGNFTYQAEIAAQPGLRGKLTAKYLSTTQYFLGSEDSDEELIGGSTGEFQNILLTYDFKSNRLICAWQPSGATITEDLDINADILIIRKAQGDAQQIRFSGKTKIDDVHYIYGVIEFEYRDMYHMLYTWDWWSYSHCMYYISFPFDVLVNDIAGVGTLGVDWRIQRYNGAKRAEKGWFEDGEKTFWEDIHAGDTLHAYEGYSLLLNRSRFNGTAGNIWDNKTYGDKVYLYFPSVSPLVGELSNQSVTVHVPAHQCTKDQTFTNSYGMLVNHKVTDSHWNMIGTPMFADTTASSIATGPVVETGYGSETLQYVYAWSYYGNTLGIKLTLDEDWRFKTMYSYMAQYAGDIVFQGPAINKVVAAKRNEEKKNYHVKLEISKDDMFIGRTYIELRENAVYSFLLNEDICMFRNGVNADLFTYAGGYEAGANVLPIANQVVPVGIAVKQAGTYVFSMPANFDGEVILVDKYAQTRTNLMLEDYEVALPTGEITDRFEVEININKVATAIDGTNGDGSLKDGNAHKFIENGMMYILQNGALYDAQGKRVK